MSSQARAIKTLECLQMYRENRISQPPESGVLQTTGTGARTSPMQHDQELQLQISRNLILNIFTANVSQKYSVSNT